MATISKRGTRWSVQIRRKGFEPEYRTFRTKLEARKWAVDREARIDRGERIPNRRYLKSTTVGGLIKRYVTEVTPKKASAESERLRLMKMANAAIAEIALEELSATHIAAYRDSRSLVVKPATVARELALLQNVVEVARTDWGFSLASNVVAQVRRIPVKNARDRRLKQGELDSLTEALAAIRNVLIRPAILLAVQTALRRGELLNITWHEVDYEQRTIHVSHTKTGYARTIPMTDAAVAILLAVPRTSERVFPMTATALRLAWNRIRKKAGVPDLRFHDLRHEAISRFAEMGLSTVELAAISGHRDLRMLSRYTHIQPAALARKLAGRSWDQEVGQHA